RVPLRPFLLPDWKSSDRPPLQTGIVLLTEPFTGARDVPYQIVGTLLQVTWVAGIVAVLRAIRLPWRTVLVSVFAIALTGFGFFNSIYVRPQMLAGAFVLAALACLLEGLSPSGRLIIAATSSAFAVLAHGGALFGVIGLLAIRPWRGWRQH